MGAVYTALTCVYSRESTASEQLVVSCMNNVDFGEINAVEAAAHRVHSAPATALALFEMVHL